MEKYTGAEVLVKSLKDLGVKQVFGYTGGTILPVFHALQKEGIDIIINSNEQAAAFSAAGYSRSSGEVGVVVVTSGPSITNTLTSVCDSFCDSIPMIVIAGQVSEHKIGTDAFQHINVPAIFAECSKKAIQINGENIENTIKDLYFFSKSGKPGPIVIDFPFDKQIKESEYSNIPIVQYKEKYLPKTHLTESQCKDFFDNLISCKKPLLYVGGGVNFEGASKALNRFNQILKIPYVNTLMGKGVIDENGELALGMLGMFGTPTANIAVQKNDLFFAIGVRWDDRVAEKVGCFGPHSKIAYIDINPEKVNQIRKERNPAFIFEGDSELVLNDLANYAEQHKITLDIESWRKEVIEIKNKWSLNYNRDSSTIQQAYAMDVLNEFIDDKTIISTGVGNHQMHAAQYLKMKVPKSFLTSGSFGTMGFGLPALIGAYYANPTKILIDVDGDSSICMNLGELKTIGIYKIPIKIIVLNNKGDGMVRNLQDAAYGGVYVGTMREENISISKIAAQCNFDFAKSVSDKENLKQSIKELLDSKGPAILEIYTDEKETLYPKIPPGKNYSEMILGPFIKENTK